jgi:hypothetical protein
MSAMSLGLAVAAMSPYRCKLDHVDQTGLSRLIESHIWRLSVIPQFKGILAEAGGELLEMLFG